MCAVNEAYASPFEYELSIFLAFISSSTFTPKQRNLLCRILLGFTTFPQHWYSWLGTLYSGHVFEFYNHFINVQFTGYNTQQRSNFPIAEIVHSVNHFTPSLIPGMSISNSNKCAFNHRVQPWMPRLATVMFCIWGVSTWITFGQLLSKQLEVPWEWLCYGYFGC